MSSENLVPDSVGSTHGVIVNIPGIPDGAKNALETIRNDMEVLYDSNKVISFLMAVNLDSGKADLIPLPTPENIVKMKEQMGVLPEGIKSAILNNVPKKDMDAIEEIWFYLNKSEGREVAPSLPPLSCPRVK